MHQLISKFKKIRQATEDFCVPMKTEDYIPQPVLFASPPKWHLAHTTWFFEEMILNKYKEDYRVFDKEYSFLFNSYYQSIGERTHRADRGSITRPGVSDIYKYRAYVDEHMIDFLNEDKAQHIHNLVELGLNHEQQHQELLITDFKYVLGLNPNFPIYKDHSNLVKDYNKDSGMISIPEGIYEIGYRGDGFCYDNELGSHKVFLHEYKISKSLVTNGEYLEFIEAGGYDDFVHWLDEGWSWVEENQIEAPLYWHKIDGKWHTFTLSGLKELDLNALLSHVSFYEANAFAAWKGMRLPTEFEWEVAADKLNWGKRWECTNSAYLPYPKFTIAEGAVGEYNGKFMVNQMVYRGASVVTSKNHSRKTYRNFFHPNMRWQYTGIRLAK